MNQQDLKSILDRGDMMNQQDMKSFFEGLGLGKQFEKAGPGMELPKEIVLEYEDGEVEVLKLKEEKN